MTSPDAKPEKVSSDPVSRRSAAVEPIMHRAARIEDAFHEFRARRARKRGFLATVVPYTGYGAPSWVRILGRVRARQGPATGQPGRAAAPQARGVGPRLALVHQRARSRRPTVTVEIEGDRHEVTTDRGGVIDTVIPVQLTPGWHTVRLFTRRIDACLRSADLHHRPEGDLRRRSPTSTTPSWSPRSPARCSPPGTPSSSTSTPACPTPGMSVLLERLAAAHPGTPVVYLSTGAWNVAPTLTRFLSRNLFPAGPLLLTDWGPTHDRLFRSGREHKRTSLERLAAGVPRREVAADRRRRAARRRPLRRVHRPSTRRRSRPSPSGSCRAARRCSPAAARRPTSTASCPARPGSTRPTARASASS